MPARRSWRFAVLGRGQGRGPLPFSILVVQPSRWVLLGPVRSGYELQSNDILN